MYGMNKKKHNFEGILVVELDYNRILKKQEWINMIIQNSRDCTG
jgi:hypothetical protein